MAGSRVRTPAYEVLNDSSNWAEVAKRLGLPLVVKPVHEGSSLGINIVDSAATLERAYRDAAEYDRDVMAEQFIDGDEYTVPILNDLSLPAIRLETDNIFMTYKPSITLRRRDIYLITR